ncbi:phage holin family protein [Lachnospiraceae bacterium OttesenSCG-928-D06]|nr:phage holin family protein [Lachnospiraceae bacterium OttesenSCG-928-D06]
MKENEVIIGKSILTSIGALIGNSIGILMPSLILLIVLMIVDYISGLFAAKKEALEHPDNMDYRISSKKSIVGIYKKVGYMITILVAICTDYIIYKIVVEIGLEAKTNTMFGMLVSIWFLINELLSILENANRMGAVLPQFLRNMLIKMRDEIETQSGEDKCNDSKNEEN